MAQMPESEKKILEEVEYLRDKYFTYDEPVPFCGLYLYPVSVRNYNEFMTSNACLLLNKNDDPMGIKFTHLDYLLSKISDEKEGVLWSMRFSKIIELCFHILPGMKCSKCGKYIPYDQFFTEERVKLYQGGTDEDRKKFFDCDCGEGKMVASLDQKKDEKSNKTVLLIDGHEIDSNNFNKLRKFILYQNLPDFKDDSWVNKEVRDDQAKKAQILSLGKGTATLERKAVCLSVKTCYKINEIYDLSIRKFCSLLSAMNDSIEYQINKTAIMSGMVKMKDGQTIDNWVYQKDEGMYGKSVSAESYVSKIENMQ